MAKNMKLKTQRIEETKDRRAKAIARYIRISPYKVRVVLDNIRGKSVNDAVAILENTSKAGAEPIKKVVLSAVANAEHNLGMNKDDLKIAVCYADPTKAYEVLGWRAERGLTKMCEDSARWQKMNPDGYPND